LAVHTNGCLFIVDYGNHAIREGVPSSNLSPPLSINVSPPNVILSWPLSASAFILETTGTMSSGTVWAPLTNGVVISANSFVLSQSIGTGPAFFRLHKP